MTKALLDEPTPEMIEAGAAALFRVSDFEGQYAELSGMSKEIYREKAYAVLNAAARSSAPQEPDDDAELLIAIADDLSLPLGNERRLELRCIVDRLQAKAPETGEG